MLSLPVRTFSPTPYYRDEGNRGSGEDGDGEEEYKSEGEWEVRSWVRGESDDRAC